MKLPISLLLLAALGEAVKVTTEKSRSSTHTTKRELREGFFGERTELLKKYVPTDTTPGSGYTADDFKPTLQGPSSTEQIFGARLPPISKISDLLSKPSPSFELALANHLYSPVSAYAVKLPTFEEKEKPATKEFFSKHKNFKHLKQLQEQSYDAQKLPTKGDSQNSDFFSYINSDFRPGPTSPPYPFGAAFSGINPSYTATPTIPFGFRLKSPTHGPLQYYHPQSPVPLGHADFDFEYENQKDVRKEREHSKGENKYGKYNPATRHELERQHPVPIEVYSAHPNGAISYSSFTNQAFLAGQPESQLVYKQYSKLQEPTLASDLRQQQQFYVPQLYQPEKQKLPSPAPQQQYYSHQAQPYYGPLQQPILLYPVDQSGKSLSPQFIPIQQPQLYLNPNRQQLLQDLQQGAALQSLNLQQPPIIYKPEATAAQSESLGPSSTHAPPAYQVTNYQSLPENTPVTYADQPAAQNSIEESSVRLFTPTPAAPVPTVSPLSVQPLQPHPTVAVEQVAITPKSHLANDQVVKPSTVQPQTIRDDQQQASHLYQDSNSLQVAQPTIQAQHSSTATLQALHINQQYSSTTPQPEILIGAHQSHTQQTQNQQVHNLEVGNEQLKQEQAPEPAQQPNGAENSKPTEATPPQYQNPSTPQPTAQSTTDYEIEIASHVDHSQLPKDLRPVTAADGDAQSQGHIQIQDGQDFGPPNQYILRDGNAETPAEDLPRHVHLNHLTQNVPPYDPNSPYQRPFLGPIQPLIQPRAYVGAQPYVVPASVQQQVPVYPVQYFDSRFPRSVFRGF